MDRNAPAAIYAGIFISVIGVFALMIMPMLSIVLPAQLGISNKEATDIVGMEVLGGALASLLAMFWISKVNWRQAIVFSVAVVVIGNVATIYVSDVTTLTAIRFLVGLLGQGVAFAIGIRVVTSET